MNIKFCLLAVLGFSTAALATNDDYGVWSKTKTITIDTRNATGGANVTTNQTNFPVLVRLTAVNANAIFTTSSFSTTGIDIRFASGSNHLSYQRERWDGTNKLAEFWVLVPVIKGNDTTNIQILWGNGSAADSSNSSGMPPVFATTNNYQAVWHMNGAATTTDEVDATSNGFTATQYNSPTAQSTGAIGYSRLLNGTSQGFIAGIPSKGQDLKSVRFIPATGTGYAVGVNGTILKTLDSGVTWASQTSGTTQTLNFVFCLDANNCVATGGNGTLISTTNGGTSWAIPTGAGGQGTGAGITQQWNSVYVIGSLTSGTAYIAGFGTGTSGTAPNGSTTVRKATITGGSWAWAATAGALATNYTARSIVCSDANNCVVGAGDDGNPRINVTTNGGTSWGNNNTPSSFTNGVFSVALVGTVASGTVYIAGASTTGANTASNLQKGTITNGVVTWGSAITSGVAQSLNSISCTDATHCIAVGAANGVVPAITSTTNGTSWTAYTNAGGLTYQAMNSVQCISTTNCYAVGAGGTTLKTTNGTTWTSLTGSNSLNFAPRGNYTISAWVKWAGTNGGDAAAHVIAQKNSHQYYLKTQTTNKWVEGEYAQNAAREAATTTSVDTAWHYVAGVRNGNTSGSVYVDGNFTGALSGTFTTSTTTPDLQDQTTGFGIGRSSESAAQFWNGRIDEVEVANTTRSTDWIKLNYETQKLTATCVVPAMDSVKLTQSSIASAPGTLITPDTAKVFGTATSFSISGPGVTDSASFRTATGLVFNRTTGIISGTVSVLQSATNYTVTATNAAGSVSANLTITISPVPPSNLSYSASSYKFGVGVAITTLTPTLGNTGGLPVTYSISPNLNANTGLSFNTANGAISGTPTLASTVISYTVTVTNDSGFTNKAISIAVQNPISTFTFATHTLVLPRSVLMTPDTATVTGTDPFTPVTYSTSPALPAGMALDTNTGIVSGTPTTGQASANYVITAKNGITSFNKLDTLHITVVAPPSGLSYSSNSINVDQNSPITSLSSSLSSNGNGTITYSISPDLAANTGLSFNTSNGAISGTATTVSATTTYTITATNIAGFTTTTLAVTVFGAEDYSQWSNFKDMTLNTGATAANVATSQSNFPILVRLNSSQRAIFQQAGTGGASIRFTNGSGTHLPYQIDRWSAISSDTSAAIWVLVNSVTGNATTTVRMYWGNGSATSRSNGSAVFTTGNGFRSVWHLGDTTGISPRPNAVAGAPVARPVNFPGAYVAKTGVVGMADTLRGGNGATLAGDFFRIADTTTNDTNYYSDFSTGFTYSVWTNINPSNPQSYVRWFAAAGGTAISNPPGDMGFGREAATSNIRFETRNASGATSNTAILTTATPLVNGVWQHLVVTVGTGATPTVKMYKNGTLLATSPAAQTGAIPVMARRKAYIGKTAWSDSCFKGLIDEAVLANVERSADWLKLNYFTQKSSVTPIFDLSYATSTAVYGKGVAITGNTPSIKGNATRWTISPALPAGLALNAGTGQITGTPTATSAATNYTVTAFSDSCWSASATVNITVNGFNYASHAVTYGKNVAVTTPDTVSPGALGSFTKYSISPNVTANTGLSFDTLTGKVSGTPNKAVALAKYTITGTFAGGTAIDTVDVIVNGFTYATKPATYGKNVAITSNTLTGGVGTFTAYAVSPALPAGLSMSTTTGVISGTPTTASVAGNYVVTGTFAGGTAKDTANITVVGFLYATKPVVFGKNVVAIPDTIGSSVGTFTGYTVSPALPAGLSLNASTGTVSGTPTVTATAANYVITGTGGSVAGVKDTVNITVSGFAYVTKPATYGKNVAITNNTVTTVGTASTSYSVNPALPSGLSLNTSTGAISGIPTVETPAADYVVTGNGGAVSGVKDTIRITINGFAYSSRNVLLGKNVAMTPDTLASGKVGTFTAFSVSPTLPTGLSLNTSSGMISGTPTAAVVSTPYVVTGTFAGGSAKDTVYATVLGIVYSNNPATYRVGAAIVSNTPTASGWSPTSYSGTLPSGLSIDDGSGIITGTPTVAAAATKYAVIATNGTVTARDTLTFTVNNALPIVAYTSPVTYARNVTIANNIPISTGGPVTGYTINPALPTGILFSLSTGVISGTPTVNSTAQNYTVIATGPGGADTVIVNISVSDAPPHITYATPAIYRLDSLANPNTPVNTGGAVSHFSISPALPAGLSMDTLTGVISGTPTVIAGTLNYTVTASGSGGTGTFQISITVTNSSAIVYADPVTYIKGVAISPNVPTKVGAVFSHYMVTPSLPSGLLLDSNTGVISGTATVTASVQGYAIKATGVSDTAMDTVSITVLDTAPAISYKHAAVVNTKGIAMVPDTMISAGGAVTVYHVTPVLPAGLLMDTVTGTLSGTPTIVSTAANYTVTATGPGGTGATVVNITVGDTAPAIFYVRPVIMAIKGVVITPDTAISSTGGSVTGYSVLPSLPAGLSMSATTGRISGTPTVVSNAANYTITATGPGGTGITVVNITVGDTAPAISYKRAVVNAVKHVAITPDTVISAGGAIMGYAINPQLPSGLIFDTSSGRISGNPDSVALAVNYVVTATGPGGTGATTINLGIQDTVPRISYVQLTLLTSRNIAINPDTVLMLGTGAIIRYSVTPVLPAGLSLDTLTGLISGIPTVVTPAANYTVMATGPGGAGTVVVNIVVQNSQPVILYPLSSAVYTKGVAITPNTVISTGGLVTSYSISPALSAGLSLDTVTGTVSGTPSGQTNPVSYTITATGPGGTGTATLVISVYTVPSSMSYADDPTIYVLGIPITPNAMSVNGLITNVSVTPALPPGLALDSLSGSISGIPTGSQHFAADYTVTASNPVGSTSGTVNIAIVGAPSDLSYPDDVPTYAVGQSIDPPNTPTIHGIVTLYTVSPSFPPGVFLDQTTGYILGTPTAASSPTDYTVTGSNPGGSAVTIINLGVIDLPPEVLPP